MKNIIYFQPEDAVKFDLDRYTKCLNKYAKVEKSKIEKALRELEKYENMHVSLLVETGVKLLEKAGGEAAAKQYFDDHGEYFGGKFERLRRITGYLVGSLERWNDGKQAEEAARVKHSVNSCTNDLVRAAKLQDQYLAHNIAYAA